MASSSASMLEQSACGVCGMRTLGCRSLAAYCSDTAIRKLATWILFISCFVHIISSSSAISDVRPSNDTSITTPSTTQSSLSSSSPPPPHAAGPQLLPLDNVPSNANSTVLRFNIPTHKPPPPTVESNNLSRIRDEQLTTSGEGEGEDIMQSTIATTAEQGQTSPPAAPKPKPTRKKIYIRGHLLSHDKSRRFHPADPAEQLKDNSGTEKGPIPQKHVGGLPKKDTDVECPPTAPRCEDDARTNGTHSWQGVSRRKKKHNFPPTRKKFHNYKLLSDTMLTASSHQSTEFYAWIFGAAMLGIISLVAMTSCFAYCLCSDKWRQRRAMRRKWDKNGEYERVDSVSSIVDNTTSTPPPPDYNDNDIDAVSII